MELPVIRKLLYFVGKVEIFAICGYDTQDHTNDLTSFAKVERDKNEEW